MRSGWELVERGATAAGTGEAGQRWLSTLLVHARVGCLLVSRSEGRFAETRNGFRRRGQTATRESRFPLGTVASIYSIAA